MTELTDEAVTRLANDCVLAANCLEAEDTFPTGQGILREAARALIEARAERDRLRADAQATNGVWQANLRLQAELAAVDALRERAEKAEAKCSQIGRELNTARYGQPDFAWSIHKEAVSELRDELAAAQQREARDAAQSFDEADWFWRTMDPDDCGDSPEEAINRAMVGQFCVCEIASSFSGPTRYGFVAPVLDPESDDEEFVHFATQQEAIDAAKTRAALAHNGRGE